MSGLAGIEVDDRDGTHVVRVRGEVDLSNASELMDAISESMPADASLVVVDLSQTEYLDSAGIAMIFQLAARQRYRRRELRLVVPADGPIRAVVELTHMHRVIPIDDARIDLPDPDPARRTAPGSGSGARPARRGDRAEGQPGARQ